MSRGLAVLAAIGATLSVGCTDEVKDVNRVQPYYIEKSMLQGEWYYRQTIVDVPPHVGIGFTGIEGKLEKVRFEVFEDQLVARRVHEAIPGLDDEQTQPGADYHGSPVMIFPVSTHFDITRQFDEQTGAQSNVLSEDSSHNRWNERRYMRVDWSQGLTGGPVDFSGLFADIATAKYTVPETHAFDADQLQIEDGHLQLTTRYTVWDGGYTCAIDFGYYPNTTNTRTWCGAGEVKVRHSFVRIDPADAAQYEPREYFDRDLILGSDGKPLRYVSVSIPDGRGGNEMVDLECTDDVLAELAPKITEADCRTLQWDRAGRFGFFRVERHGFDRLVGAGHDQNRQFFATQHKIWEQVFEWEMTTGSDGKPVIATDADGKPQVKLDDQGHPVAIPLAERTVRPLTYYLNVNFPEDLVETAEQLGKDWNAAFLEAIAAAQGKTMEQVGQDIEAEHDHPYAFRVVRNTCSNEGIAAYLTDNPEMQPVVDEGTGGAAIQPGNLLRVCAALTHFSRAPEYAGAEPFTWQQIGDVRFSFIYWVNEEQPSGPLGYGPSSSDAESGRLLSGNAYVYGAAIDRYARDSADVIRAMNGDDDVQEIIDGDTYDKWVRKGTTVADDSFELTAAASAELTRRLGTGNIWGAERVIDEHGHFDKAAMMRHMRQRVNNPAPDDPLSRPVIPGNGRADALIAQLRANPELRARLIPAEIQALAERMIAWAPVEGNPEDIAELAIQMTVDPGYLGRKMRERSQFYMERNVFLPEFIDDSVYGQALELRGQDPELVYQTLRREIFRAVTLHEVGHTVGLTHNFKASFDALNYPDEFWKIRNSHGAEDRDAARLPEFRYSSIMDYGARFNSDTKGLGKYDHAAIKFAYGRNVEAFAADVPVKGRLTDEIELSDYRTIPSLLGGAVIDDNPADPLYDPENLWKRVNRPIADVIDDRREEVVENAKRFLERRDRPASDYQRDRTVPYSYCSDRFRGDLKCRTWDEGANHEEAVASAIQRYWNYYFFNSWRRGRAEIPFYLGFFSRQDRLREYLTYPFKFLTFYDPYKMPDGSPSPVALDLAKASLKGLNFISQVVGAPEPGDYCLFNVGSQVAPNLMFLPTSVWASVDTARGCNRIRIPLGEGRNPYIDLTNDYQARYDYMGSFYDKVYLIDELFNDATAFFRVSDESDMRRFNISYYQAFQPEIIRLVSDTMWSALGITGLRYYYDNAFQSSATFGRRVFNYVVEQDPAQEGEYLVRPNLLVDPRTFGTNQQSPLNELPQVWILTQYNMLRSSLLQAIIYDSHSNDLRTDFADYVAVTEEGSGEDRQYAEDADVIRFRNPKTGATLVAAQTNDGQSLAYDLIESMNALAEGEWADRRRLYEADPSDTDATWWYEQVDQDLESYLGLVEDLRVLRSAVDYR